jgi:hypothetical protein
MVRGLSSAVGQVSVQVVDVSREQRETRGELATLRADFLEFARQTERRDNIQRAETRIGVLQDKIQHEYGHHKLVRKSAIGMLQAFDVGLVAEDSVRAIGDQLMIQTPRYWLAPVLVALAAWAGDDPDLCRRAVEEAFRRSPSRTSLFMALVLRRQGRRASAVRWLRHYLNAQDPAALGRDFAVILESVSQGAFGPAGIELIRETLDRWRVTLMDDESAQRAQVDRWRVEVEAHVAAPPQGRFPRLAALSPQWPRMELAAARAGAHQRLLATYSAMVTEEVKPSDRLEDAVDDILDRLVGNPDDEELPLHRELAYNEAVVRHGGDLAASDAATRADASAYETTLDYLTIQTMSALNPDAIGVSRSTQRVAVASCHEWFTQAHAAFTRDYRLTLPDRVEAVFGSDHSVGAQAFQLPRWVGSFTEPMDRLERSLGAHWDRHGQAYVERFAFSWRSWVALGAVVMLAALAVVSACAGFGAGVLVTLVGGAAWALVLRAQQQAAERKQAEARESVARAKHDSIAQLRGAGAELTDWGAQFRELDGQEARVRELIRDLSTLGHGATPFQRRAVTYGESEGSY